MFTSPPPALTPSSLRSATNPADFPLHAPIILDIYLPSTNKRTRVLTKVSAIEKDINSVSVVGGSQGLLSNGMTINMAIKPRSAKEWVNICLDVVDDDYQGGEIDFRRSPGAVSVIPAGFNAVNEPYFAHPVYVFYILVSESSNPIVTYHHSQSDIHPP